MSDLLHQITNYGRDLEQFMSEESLPPEWFEYPDYLAIKAANGNHFDDLIESFKSDEISKAKKISCTVVGERPFATAFLFGELVVGSDWGVELVNITGPRVGEETRLGVGVDHVGFYTRVKLNEIDDHLQIRAGIYPEYEHAEAGGHTSLNVPFESSAISRRVKFAARRLPAIVSEELLSGVAHIIYQSDEDKS